MRARGVVRGVLQVGSRRSDSGGRAHGAVRRGAGGRAEQSISARGGRKEGGMGALTCGARWQAGESGPVSGGERCTGARGERIGPAQGLLAGQSLAGVARVGLLAQERRRAGAKAGPLGAAGPRKRKAGLGHWVGLEEFGFGLGLVFLFYSISKANIPILIEFKFQFEFKPSTQTKRTMHQHECNNKIFKLRQIFITCETKIN